MCLLAGIVPTPAVAYLTTKYRASFGIVISASHNPFQDNGIKFFGATGYKLTDESERAIESEYLSTRQPTSFQPADRLAGSVGYRKRQKNMPPSLLPRSRKDFSLSGVKIAVDMANGAAYQTTPMVLAMLGANVDLHSGAPDGFNINAECGSTHPATLSRLVQESGAAFGIAHDGDADRLLFCDDHGIATRWRRALGNRRGRFVSGEISCKRAPWWRR